MEAICKQRGGRSG